MAIAAIALRAEDVVIGFGGLDGGRVAGCVRLFNLQFARQCRIGLIADTGRHTVHVPRRELAGDPGKDAKTSVIAEMRQKFGELDLTLEEVLELEGNKKTRKAASPKAKYRSPDGQEWSGRGRIAAWLKKLEDEGHSREEYKVEAEH